MNSDEQLLLGIDGAQVTLDACTLKNTADVACVTVSGERSSLSMRECSVKSGAACVNLWDDAQGIMDACVLQSAPSL